MYKLRISPFENPYLNLALENSFLENLDSSLPVLFLYINEPSVVIGRFQNPWVESNPSRLKDIHLVRRQSGGGTVYHDRGNLNFSFICSQKDYDKTANLNLVCQVLKKHGILLGINERHDLVVQRGEDIFKVSGSAFRLKKDRVFHHGTLLIDSQKDDLRRAIAPCPDRQFIHAGGTASQRSRVINLADLYPQLSPAIVCDLFRNSFPEEKMNWETLAASSEVEDEKRRLMSDEWVLDKTPPFKQNISAVRPPGHRQEGDVLLLEIQKGIIWKAPVSLSFLEGIPYGRKETAEALQKKLQTRSGMIGSEDKLFSRLLDIIG